MATWIYVINVGTVQNIERHTVNTIEKIKVMQAWLDGKRIRYRVEGDVWHYTDNSCICPPWDWSKCVYEIAPREFWINVYTFVYSRPYTSKEAADTHATTERIECIHVQEMRDDNI